VQGLLDFLKSLGAARIAAMCAVTIALVGFFGFLILRVTAPQMTPLFTDLTLEDSTAIVKELERQGIAYELRNDGEIVLAPKDRVPRLRMSLAEAGLPKGGGVGYEIFDKSDALGATSFVQNINHLRALEGELSRTIRSLDRVLAARVHLVLPERPLFSREAPEASASIVLKVRGKLEPQQVNAIRHLTASAVTGLKPERVSIVDETGRLLADGARGAENGGDSADDRQIAYQQRLRQQVEEIVSSVVGPGHARVQLTADFDFNRVTQTSEKFDPEGRVLRSSQTREESAATADNKQGQVTVANAVPGAPAPDTAAATRDQSRKTEEIVNYEISRSTKTEVTEGGRLNRVSVAVLVDGNYTRNDKGEPVYPAAREGRDRSHRGPGALIDRVRPETRRPGRGGKSTFCRGPEHHRAGAHGPDELPAVHQGRHHALGRTARHGAARHRGPSAGGAPPGQPHHRVGPASRGAQGRRHRARRREGRHHGGRRRRRDPGGSQRHRQDDRCRPSARPGSRSVGAEGWRTRRQKPDRSHLHHPQLVARERVVERHGPPHPQAPK
jgi:flagellar M-ring protein FliF